MPISEGQQLDLSTSPKGDAHVMLIFSNGPDIACRCVTFKKFLKTERSSYLDFIPFRRIPTSQVYSGFQYEVNDKVVFSSTYEMFFCHCVDSIRRGMMKSSSDVEEVVALLSTLQAAAAKVESSPDFMERVRQEKAAEKWRQERAVLPPVAPTEDSINERARCEVDTFWGKREPPQQFVMEIDLVYDRK